MNAHFSPLKNRPKGDLYLLLKKQRVPKLVQFKETVQSKDSKNSNSNLDDRKNSKPFSAVDFQTPNLQTNKNQRKSKLYRKDSEVSIVQDFEYEQKSPIKKIGFSKENQYVINVSTCPRIHLDYNQEINRNKQISKNLENQAQKKGMQMLDRYMNFTNFFHYVLDFKMMKIQSYNPSKHDLLMSKLDESINPKSKKHINSLSIHFTDQQAEKNTIKPQQVKAESHQNKDQRKRQLETSQISLVDVRISNASIQDFSPTFKNQRKKLNLSPNSQMKKQRKVYFDFQNPLQTSLQQPEQVMTIMKSQKMSNTLYKSQTQIIPLDELKRKMHHIDQHNKYVHHGYFCDECKIDPIQGRRYRCIECDEYDLCEKCYQKQCAKFGDMMNKDQYEDFQEQTRNHCNRNNYFPEMRPLFKKEMSDIKQEQIVSQKYSSEQEDLFFSSQKDLTPKQHVHLMEEVIKTKNKQQFNFQNILKQTNGSIIRSITGKDNKDLLGTCKGKSPFLDSWNKSKLMNSGIRGSRLAFSQRSIPNQILQGSQRKLFETNRKQIQELKRASNQIKNLFK